MKRKHLLLIFALALSLLPRAAQAQTSGYDYFVQPSNNEATHPSNDKIHFKLLIYAKGTDNEGWVAGGLNPYTNPYSYLAITRHSGYDSDHTGILYYRAKDNRNEIGYVSNTPHDQAVAYIKVLEGKVVVTNTYEGSALSFFPSDTLQEVLLHREQVDGDLAYLEFDWFPPASYPDTTLYSFLSARFCKLFSNWQEASTFNFDAFIYRADQRPQLMDPFFYPIHTNGDSTCGRIGVPYICYQDLYQYHTSWNNTNILSSKRSDILKITGTDSVQHNFSLVMQTKNSHSTTDSVIKQWLSTDPVDIPAYHKIHDFSVQPYVIRSLSHLNDHSYLYDYRYPQLFWKLYMPSEQDC